MSQPGWIGQSNPMDEGDNPEREPKIEMADGRKLTLGELAEELSKLLKWVSFRIDDHYDGRAELSVPFEEGEA